MTYRTGNHHGITIISENDGARCGWEGHDCERGHLAAVVTEGGLDFAEHICELLNAPTPDVPYTHGGREALAEVRRRLDRWDKLNPLHAAQPALATVYAILRDAAAELGLDEDAPSGRLSATESAQQPSGHGSGCTGTHRGTEDARSQFPPAYFRALGIPDDPEAAERTREDT